MKKDFIEKNGGNGIVKIYRKKGIAIKTLRESSYEKKEKVDRYFNEIKALEIIKQLHLNNIVEIIETNKKNKTITMKAYNGDLSRILYKTKGNARTAIELILPIIKDLKVLAEIKTPIYHRDIKPANILYEKISGKYNLVLSDFGCCYLNDEKNRITPPSRFVGALQYRAPEYEYGRVEQVSEKGDIFAIGKLLWTLVNGEKDYVFPYTLWYPKEYNLEKRFPDNKDIARINIIIAQCVSIEPEERPSYKELISQLENIINEVTMNSNIDKIRYLEANAKKKNERLEQIAFIKTFLIGFYDDLYEMLELITKEYPENNILELLKSNFSNIYKSKTSSIESFIKCSDSSIVIASDINTSLRIYYVCPKHPNYVPALDGNYPWVYFYYQIGQIKSDNLNIGFSNKNMQSKYKDNIINYNKDIIIKFFEDFISDYTKSAEI